MDTVTRVGKATMYNLGGALREVNISEVVYLKSIGWLEVLNPKRNYAPELDRANRKNISPTTVVEDDMNQDNILKFDYV
jgi:hypothetical protein